jgi:hypothetical protein
MNLLIYITTNRDYREAYRHLFWPRRTLPSKTLSLSYATGNTPPPPPPPLPPKPTNLFNQIRPRPAQAKSWMTRMVIGLSLLGVATAGHEPMPDLSTKAPACAEKWETHHVIPACVQTAHWLYIQTNGSMCARSQQCLEETTMVSPDAKSCIPTRSCSTRRTLNVDSLQCQTGENATLVERLRVPPLRSTLCSVGALTLRNCPDYVEQFEDVPMAIVDGQAYPLDVLRISQYADTANFSSYTCKGSCDHKCEGTECHGDTIFCAHFTCAKPCWGSMHVAIRKEIKRPNPAEYLCDSCTIECTTTGILESTPGHVSRYIRVHKNPGHVATFPSSAAESITLTNNMLATTGKITVQIWFQDYDVPSIREITCPRIPICTLIRCNLCIERWLNFSCYDAYHWVILSSLGLLGDGLIILCTQVLRTAKNISWYLSWPVRCLIRSLKRRSSKSTPKSRNDEEVGNWNTSNTFGHTSKSVRPNNK